MNLFVFLQILSLMIIPFFYIRHEWSSMNTDPGEEAVLDQEGTKRTMSPLRVTTETIYFSCVWFNDVPWLAYPFLSVCNSIDYRPFKQKCIFWFFIFYIIEKLNIMFMLFGSSNKEKSSSFLFWAPWGPNSL